MLTRSGPGDDRPPKVALAVHGRRGRVPGAPPHRAPARPRRGRPRLRRPARRPDGAGHQAHAHRQYHVAGPSRELDLDRARGPAGAQRERRRRRRPAERRVRRRPGGAGHRGRDREGRQPHAPRRPTSAIVTTSPPECRPAASRPAADHDPVPGRDPGRHGPLHGRAQVARAALAAAVRPAPRYTVDGGAFSAHVTIEAPAGFPLQTKEQGFTAERRYGGDSVVYDWRLEREDTKAEINRQPYIIASSFRDYLQLGEAYGERARPKLVVTPRVQELADRLTAGVDDRREQVRQLYEHVVRNVRYEALALGSGRVVPRDPTPSSPPATATARTTPSCSPPSWPPRASRPSRR